MRPAYLGLSKKKRLTELCRKIDAGGDGGRSPEHLAQYDLMPCRKFVSGTLSMGASGGVMKLDGSLCNANVSLTDLIKGWFVALTKQLNAYPSRTIRLFASSRVKLVALAS